MRIALGACSLIFALACASAPSPVARAAPNPTLGVAPTAASAPRVEGDAERARPLEETGAVADDGYRDELGAGIRDDRFATDRQVAALRRAIVLYKEFLERAADEPRYAEAAKRSRDRIDDAEKTIEFLLAESQSARR